MKNKHGLDSSQAIMALRRLAEACLAANQPEKALAMFEQFVQLNREKAKPDDLIFASQLAEISLRLLEYHQYAAAELYVRECLAIREKHSPDDWRLFNTKSMLGGALAGQKKFQEAAPHLVEGYSGLKAREAQIPPAAHPRLAEAARRLIELYTEWDKPEEAAKWKEILKK